MVIDFVLNPEQSSHRRISPFRGKPSLLPPLTIIMPQGDFLSSDLIKICGSGLGELLF
jgi:hypothetical protein